MPPIACLPLRKTKRRKRDALALANLDWALGIARHVATLLPTWFTEDDLMGAAEIALLRAADQYRRVQEPGFAHPVSFRAYASRRIYGACWDAVRRKEYRERGHQTLSDTTSNLEDHSLSPEEQAAEHEQLQVWASVQRLPSRHALVILAVYGGGMTLEQLATKVDVGSSRLSQIHHEALDMLRGMAA